MIVCLAVSAGSGFAVVSADFSRYDIILSRKPFGEPPPKPAITAPPTAAAKPAPPKVPFNKHLQMAAITEDDIGTRVGFFDTKKKKSFFLGVGETTEDGITLVSADYKEGKAILRKGSEEYMMGLDGKSAKGPGHGKTAAKPEPADVPPKQETKKIGQPKLVRPMSYVERLRLRRETEKKTQAKQMEEAVEAAAQKKIDLIDRNELLRKYNLELIRAKGKKGKPLPIQLTPEEDAMLVKEGVLPPRE